MYATLAAAAAAVMGMSHPALAQPSGIASKAFPWDPATGQTMNGQCMPRLPVSPSPRLPLSNLLTLTRLFAVAPNAVLGLFSPLWRAAA